jgi:hypothetical protein
MLLMKRIENVHNADTSEPMFNVILINVVISPIAIAGVV